jgi:hypothetical protein
MYKTPTRLGADISRISQEVHFSEMELIVRIADPADIVAKKFQPERAIISHYNLAHFHRIYEPPQEETKSLQKSMRSQHTNPSQGKQSWFDKKSPSVAGTAQADRTEPHPAQKSIAGSQKAPSIMPTKQSVHQTQDASRRGSQQFYNATTEPDQYSVAKGSIKSMMDTRDQVRPSLVPSLKMPAMLKRDSAYTN